MQSRNPAQSLKPMPADSLIPVLCQAVCIRNRYLFHLACLGYITFHAQRSQCTGHRHQETSNPILSFMVVGDPKILTRHSQLQTLDRGPATPGFPVQNRQHCTDLPILSSYKPQLPPRRSSMTLAHLTERQDSRRQTTAFDL